MNKKTRDSLHFILHDVDALIDRLEELSQDIRHALSPYALDDEPTPTPRPKKVKRVKKPTKPRARKASKKKPAQATNRSLGLVFDQTYP